MEKRIEELGQNWKTMPRNNVEDIQAADRYYNENIMPLSAEKFFKCYGDTNKVYDLMLVTVGTSWQPIVLSIMVKCPKEVVFLATEGVKNDIATALAFMEKMGQPLVNYKTIIVDKSESAPLIKAVKDIYDRVKPVNSCFDITGGTKAMAAAAGMIGAALDMEIFYVESNYLPVYRHPEPGSERMVKLQRPKDVL